MANRNEIKLLFTGQAGFIVYYNDATIGIDLYLSDSVERYDGYKRLSPKIIMPHELSLDMLIATHAHYDHFDPDSVPQLLSNRKTKLLAAYDCKQECRKLGIEDEAIIYVRPGDIMDDDAIKIEFVYCDHGESAPDAVGVIFNINGKNIYITGDTCLRLEKMKEMIHGRTIDVLIAPINGAFGNMNEYDVVKLCKAIKPKLVIPCHYWMFAQHHGDPGLFVDILKQELLDQNYALMRVGELIYV